MIDFEILSEGLRVYFIGLDAAGRILGDVKCLRDFLFDSAFEEAGGFWFGLEADVHEGFFE